MAPIEDNTISNADVTDAETEMVNGGEFENENCDEDGMEYMQDTVPVDDMVGFEEAYEAQVVDPDDEIPVMDLGGESQVVNLWGEMQVVEELYGVENICAQVLDENNFEVTIDSDFDTQELSDDDSGKRGDNCSISPENLLKTGFCKRDDGISKEQLDASSVKHQSGSVHSGFTSIRAASVRATGLAAYKMALKRANGQSYSPKGDCSSLKQHAADHNMISDVRYLLNSGKEINREFGQDGYNEEIQELMNESRFNSCSSIVRRLFTEDEFKQPDGGLNASEDAAILPPSFAFEDGVAGLSYISSQEPGEASQANALDFVDRFLKVNVVECDQEFDIRRSTGGKSKVFSTAKGTQSLARTAMVRNNDKNGIFDWDDNHEDEGGGDFFRKMKDLFFGNVGQTGKYFTHLGEARCLDTRGSKAVQNCRDEEEEHLETKKKLKDSACSDSRIVLRKTRGSSKSSRLTEKFEKEFDEQLNSVSGDGMVDTVTGKKEPEMVGIGPDTQMAVEAMETLCFGIVVPDKGCSNAGEGAQNMQKGCQKTEAKSRVHNKQSFLPKEACFPKAGVVTRQSMKRNCTEVSKEVSLSSAQSKNVRKQRDQEAVKAQSKRAKFDAEKCFAKNDSGNMSSVCSKIGKQRRERRSLNKSVYDEIEKCHDTALTAQVHVEKHGLQEQLAFTPVAHRTRRCREVNQITSAGKELNDSRDKMNDPVRVVASRKKNKLDANASETSLTKDKADHAVELRIAKSVSSELSDSKCCGRSGALKIDAPDYRKGQRTCIKLPLNTQEANTCYNTRSNRRRIDANSTSMDINNVANANTIKWSDKKSDGKVKIFAEGAEATGGAETPPSDKCKSSASACTTPINSRSPVDAASPIYIGDDYHKQSCRKILSRSPLMKEVCCLIKTGRQFTHAVSHSRRRRDMADIRVLFSHHLDADVIKQQKKILTQLGASEASSMSNATHFIADEFFRTRNMLEAIAFGKPVVTHLWLESCGQASCLIDEKKFILRDARKEKQFGFSMPVSLAGTCQNPLLQGRRVLITPNTKPGKEILASLVKAVRGMAVERLGRSALRDEKLPDNLLILSCEEDYEICMPFLEKGAAVYSSELLLNGIVTQKLEYERHRLFLDRVKRTRSTIWVKKNDNQYLPVTRCK